MKKRDVLSNENNGGFSKTQSISDASDKKFSVQASVSGLKSSRLENRANSSALKSKQSTANGATNSDTESVAKSKFKLPTGSAASANNVSYPSSDAAALISTGLSSDNPTVSEVVGGGHTIPTEKTDGDQFSQLDTEYEQSHFTDLTVPTLQNTVADRVYGNTDFFRGKTCGEFEALNAKSEKTDNENENDGNYKSNKDNKSTKTDEADNEKDRAVTVKSGEKAIKTIVIAGQIEGHTQLPQGQKATSYEELIPQLVEIEESDEISGLLLILNTVGGDVEAGLALSELIAGMKKPTASLVLGGGHSIGVPLAVAAKKSFIAPSATMTLHPVRVTGMVLSAPQTYVYLNNMQERIIDFTCSHCRISKERFYELMLAREEMSTDLGSVLDGKKAVDEGIIDTLGTLADAISYLSGGRR